MVKEIILTQDKVTLVDDEDYNYLNQFKWYAHKSGHTYYAVRSNHINNKCEHILMHRILLNAGKNMVVDHLDGDGLNNCKQNIRLVTVRINNQNRSYHRNGKLVGVLFLPKYTKRPYQSTIKINNKIKILGYYSTPEEAHNRYLQEANKL